MITNLISMNGYGIYVTLSFGITTLACLIIYLKTLKTLKKYEREFSVELQKLGSTISFSSDEDVTTILELVRQHVGVE